MRRLSMMSGESGLLEAAEGMERGNRSKLSRRWALWELEERDAEGRREEGQGHIQASDGTTP